MKASEFISLQEEKPFWGKDSSGDTEVFVKRYDGIYGLGWDAPIDVDKVEFIEYIKPAGWKPPTVEQVENTEAFKTLVEKILLS